MPSLIGRGAWEGELDGGDAGREVDPGGDCLVVLGPHLLPVHAHAGGGQHREGRRQSDVGGPANGRSAGVNEAIGLYHHAQTDILTEKVHICSKMLNIVKISLFR